MKIRLQHSRVMIAAGVMLFTLGSASAARAGCGHYVSIRGEQKLPPDLTSGQDLPAPFHPVPCSGPRCSQGQPPMTPPPAVAVSSENDRESLPWLATVAAADSRRWLMFDSAPMRPLGSHSAIYHPPR
jgi:hypothetical protein